MATGRVRKLESERAPLSRPTSLDQVGARPRESGRLSDIESADVICPSRGAWPMVELSRPTGPKRPMSRGDGMTMMAEGINSYPGAGLTVFRVPG